MGGAMKTIFSRGGFTLVEILLALTIFAIAMTTLFTAFNTVISGVEPLKSGMNDFKSARIAMDRIKTDLMSLCLTLDPAYLLPPEADPDAPPDQFRFVSETGFLNGSQFSQLRFAAFEHLAFSPRDVNRIGIIRYYVDVRDDSAFVLKRHDIGAAYADDDKTGIRSTDPVLCDRILAFDVTFTDQNGDPKDTWNSDGSDFGYGTPLAATIQLEVGDEQKSARFETSIFLPVFREISDD